jgi:hypothetical protein
VPVPAPPPPGVVPVLVPMDPVVSLMLPFSGISEYLLFRFGIRLGLSRNGATFVPINID